MNKAIKTNKNIFLLLKNKTYNIFLLFLIFFSIIIPTLSQAKTEKECMDDAKKEFIQHRDDKKNGVITQNEYIKRLTVSGEKLTACRKSASDYTPPPPITPKTPPTSTTANDLLLQELPGLTNSILLTKFSSDGSAGFIYYLNWIIRISIALGSIIAVATLIFGGFMYITTDNFISKGKGRSMIQNSLLGLLLILTSYVILGQINPDLLQTKFGFEKIQVVANEKHILGIYQASLVPYTNDTNTLKKMGYEVESGQWYNHCWNSHAAFNGLFTNSYVGNSDIVKCIEEATKINKTAKDVNKSKCVIIWKNANNLITKPTKESEKTQRKICIFQKK